jgi:hypothetical protein
LRSGAEVTVRPLPPFAVTVLSAGLVLGGPVITLVQEITGLDLPLLVDIPSAPIPVRADGKFQLVYGAEAIAVADARVASIKDGIADNVGRLAPSARRAYRTRRRMRDTAAVSSV